MIIYDYNSTCLMILILSIITLLVLFVLNIGINVNRTNNNKPRIYIPNWLFFSILFLPVGLFDGYRIFNHTIYGKPIYSKLKIEQSEYVKMFGKVFYIKTSSISIKDYQ